MLTTTKLTHRALQVTVSGDLTPADITRSLAELDRYLEEMPQLDILADVIGSPKITLGLIAEELRHLPTIFRLIRALDRVALVADAAWMRTTAKIEGALIPGVTYQVYRRAEAAHARAWLLRETDVAHPAR